MRVLGALLALAGCLATGLTVPSSAAPPPWELGWNMAGHDPQHTFREPVAGPLQPHLLFQRRNVYVGLVDAAGNMYGLKIRHLHRYVAARFDRRGRLRLMFKPSVGAVGIAPNGVIYATGADEGTLHAFAPSGRELWTVSPTGLLKSATPLVTADGRLFAPFEGHPQDGSAGLDIFRANGRRQRIEPGTSFFAAAVASDGTIYALAIDGDVGSLSAFNRNGSALWRHELTQSPETYGTCDCILIGRQGQVYVTDGMALVAYDAAGRLLWRSAAGDGAIALAERADGSLLVAGRQTLRSLAPDGHELWQVSTATSVQAMERPELVTDAAGTAYVGLADGSVRVIAGDGRAVARLDAGGYHYGFTPGLLLDGLGRLLVDGTDSTLRVYG